MENGYRTEYQDKQVSFAEYHGYRGKTAGSFGDSRVICTNYLSGLTNSGIFTAVEV